MVKKQLAKLDKTVSQGPAPHQALETSLCKCRSKHSKKTWGSWDLFQRKKWTCSFRAWAQILRQRQGIPGPSVKGASRRFLCLRGCPFQDETLAQAGVQLNGAWGGLLCDSYIGPPMPQDRNYEEVCKRCSAALFTPVPHYSGSDTDPSTDID